MKFYLFIFILVIKLEGSQNKIILDDNFDLTIDKISHATTSFGLYYTFRYFKNSKVKSAFYSFMVGCSYEVYQIYDPFEQEYFRGISLHDITYNLVGIMSAVILDKFITDEYSNKILFFKKIIYNFNVFLKK